MRDYDTAIRKGYYDVLSGNITVDGSVIPVVDEKLDTQLTEHDIYVKLSTQQAQPGNNKCYKAATVIMNIDIVQRTATVASKLTVDDVADQALQLLFTGDSPNISLSAPFSLTYADLQGSSTSPLQLVDSKYITIKTLTFNNRITQ